MFLRQSFSFDYLFFHLFCYINDQSQKDLDAFYARSYVLADLPGIAFVYLNLVLIVKTYLFNFLKTLKMLHSGIAPKTTA